MVEKHSTACTPNSEWGDVSSAAPAHVSSLVPRLWRPRSVPVCALGPKDARRDLPVGAFWTGSVLGQL